MSWLDRITNRGKTRGSQDPVVLSTSRLRLLQVALFAVSGGLLAVTVYARFAPLTMDANAWTHLENRTGVSADLSSSSNRSDWKKSLSRRRLFMPLSPLPTRGVGNQSMERIKARLSLNAILNQNGKHVAYINVNGLGLKPCVEGDEVEGLFKVIRIQPPNVELEIVGHRVMF